MNLKKILLATDFSASTELALAYAEMLARDSGATMLVVHVQEPVIRYDLSEMQLPAPLMPNPHLERELKKIVPRDQRIVCEHRLVIGPAVDSIVELARREGVDLIVLGTHGRTGLARLLMGSVAEGVVRRATCPVLTLRQQRGMVPAADAGLDGSASHPALA